VEDRVQRSGDVDVVGDVVLDEVEPFVAGQVSDVLHAAGAQVVYGDDFVSFRQQAVAEMGANESGPARDQNAHPYLPEVRG
jgi:hypothetical protein